ncbi:hypothetical protein [Sphingomonas sp. PAMC 26605]|uniref:hypothetical protein n=1 Tax=Sphingomonas sp. PAMC 26605 TaxID=1112214 RepID=UPI00026CD1D8|nr:hypothetical protein [Sphingomonas sp. PAMC 26605]
MRLDLEQRVPARYPLRAIRGLVNEAWCYIKSFRPKDEIGADDPPADGPGGRNGEIAFRDPRHSNETHASTTDPDAQLYRKSPGAGLHGGTF